MHIELKQHLEAIWDFRDRHIPAVHAQPWHDLIPSDDEAQMLVSEHPVQSFGIHETPDWLRELPIGQRLRCAAQATMQVLVAAKPLYHRSLVSGRIIEATGTTLLVTARGRRINGHRGIIAIPWSHGELYEAIGSRFIDRRRGQPRLSPSDMILAMAYLPVWQAVVSCVPQERPIASLMGSGGSTPTEICVGTKWITFTSEHRLFTPDDGARFTELWFQYLKRGEV